MTSYARHYQVSSLDEAVLTTAVYLLISAVFWVPSHIYAECDANGKAIRTCAAGRMKKAIAQQIQTHMRARILAQATLPHALKIFKRILHCT
jgi:hypothetical protein